MFRKIFGSVRRLTSFTSSNDYWEKRYVEGGNSGDGSYGKLSAFKAKFLNDFMLKNNINNVIELGSGDGNQASLFNFKNYLGIDVSRKAVEMSNAINNNKSNTLNFTHIDDHDFSIVYECAISLDVIYHLVENKVFEDYMKKLFNSAYKFVIIYSSDRQKVNILPHVKERCFTNWIDINVNNWRLLSIVVNPLKPASIADFYIYTRSDYNSEVNISCNG